jgi:hypothetical protein
MRCLSRHGVSFRARLGSVRGQGTQFGLLDQAYVMGAAFPGASINSIHCAPLLPGSRDKAEFSGKLPPLHILVSESLGSSLVGSGVGTALGHCSGRNPCPPSRGQLPAPWLHVICSAIHLSTWQMSHSKMRYVGVSPRRGMTISNFVAWPHLSQLGGSLGGLFFGTSCTAHP